MNHQCTRFNTFQSPLSQRYASTDMLQLFSARTKYRNWRLLWIALAEAEAELGLPITPHQIDQLKTHIDEFDWQLIDRFEEQLQHDVMAHIHAYGHLCPDAKGIIHLGATSCYVTDNGDLIQMRSGLTFLEAKLRKLLGIMSQLADKYAETPCLGYTHFQPAQLTTVGKRICLWAQDFLNDLHELQYRLQSLQFLGVKGATGTQASFLALFDFDETKLSQLENLVAAKMQFTNVVPISGQTYSRKQDCSLLNALAAIGISAHKCATDLRLLAHTKEMQEPFKEQQIGSSAMPYKRNPILSERICSLARFLIALPENANYTAATQWLERSLDDSANRRLIIADAFLTADALLNLLLKVFTGIHVNEQIVQSLVDREIPFMCTENILMEAVKSGADRQLIHEKLRLLALQSSQDMLHVNTNTTSLLEKILQDPDFKLTPEKLDKIKNVRNFTGAAAQQTRAFIKNHLDNITSA